MSGDWSRYQSPCVEWFPFPCSGSCVRVQNALILVPIDCCNPICKSRFGLHFQLQMQWRESQETSVAAVGVLLKSPVIPQQAILCSLLRSALLNSRPPHCGSMGYRGSYHHSVYPAYCHFLSPRVSPDVLLYIQRALQASSLATPSLTSVQGTRLHWLAGLSY
jgi:hypothetical protein